MQKFCCAPLPCVIVYTLCGYPCQCRGYRLSGAPSFLGLWPDASVVDLVMGRAPCWEAPSCLHGSEPPLTSCASHLGNHRARSQWALSALRTGQGPRHARSYFVSGRPFSLPYTLPLFFRAEKTELVGRSAKCGAFAGNVEPGDQPFVELVEQYQVNVGHSWEILGHSWGNVGPGDQPFGELVEQ